MHTVKQGETVYSISKLYGVKEESLKQLNGLLPSNAIYEGQELLIPGKGFVTTNQFAKNDDKLF